MRRVVVSARARRRFAPPLAAWCLTGCTIGEGDGLDLERMREQRRADPFERNLAFADGHAMRHPPPGTVPYGVAAADPAVTLGRGADGTPLATIPVPVTPSLLLLGRDRFLTFCAPCHGAAGFGGSVVAMNMIDSLPPSLRSAEVQAHPPGHIYHVLVNGKGRMPPYAAELSPTDRWAVVAYVRQLRALRLVTEAERRDSARAELMARRETNRARADTALPQSTPTVP